MKFRYFHCLNNSLFYGSLQLEKSCFQKIDLFKLLKITTEHCFKFNVSGAIHKLLYCMVFGRVSATPYCNYFLLCIYSEAATRGVL